jgi:hypothetical protein
MAGFQLFRLFVVTFLFSGSYAAGSCSILRRQAFCSNICDNVAEHFHKRIEKIEVNEPNNGDPFIVNLDCLMYFPNAKVRVYL